MANIGLGTGYNNPYLQAVRLNQSADPASYNPEQYTDPQAIAAQMFAQQQGMLKQSFNQENPRMALPQNVGSALGSFIGGQVSPQQTPQSTGDQQGAPNNTAMVKSQIDQDTSANLQTNPNYYRAQYLAATGIIKDPRYANDPNAQAIAAKYIEASVKHFDPSTLDDEDVKTATKQAALDKAKTDAMADKLDKVYQVHENQPKPDGSTDYTPYGTSIPMYNQDGTPNTNFSQQVSDAYTQARQAGAKNPSISKITDYETARNKEAEVAQQIALKQQSADQSSDPTSSLTPQQKQALSGAIANGQFKPSDLGSGKNAQGTWKMVADALIANPTLNVGDINAQRAAKTAWSNGGVLNRNLMSLGTALRHTDSTIGLIDSLDNTDPAIVNRAKNAFQTEFGLSSAPASAQAATLIWAREVLKSINPNGGTGEEAAQLQNVVDANGVTGDVAKNTLKTVESMFLDRGLDMKNRYASSTKSTDFNTLLGAGGPFDKALREHERNLYQGQTTIPNGPAGKQAYMALSSGSPYTRADGQIGVKP